MLIKLKKWHVSVYFLQITKINNKNQICFYCFPFSSLTALIFGSKRVNDLAFAINGCASNSLVSALFSGLTSKHLSKKLTNSDDSRFLLSSFTLGLPLAAIR